MPSMHLPLPRLFALACFASLLALGAGRAQAADQDAAEVATVAEQFLRQQLAHLPGEPEIGLEAVRTDKQPACEALSAFLPSGARLRSRMAVGIRCAGPKPWTLYVQATVSVPGTYFVAARALPLGHTISESNLSPRAGDLLNLAPGTIVHPAQAVGYITSQRVGAGQALRASSLRHAQSVLRGHTVRVQARGPGFMVSSEGQALENAAPGNQVQVRTPNGQIVIGVVQDAGTVEIQL
ncbi:Flagellar basal-body P-ring formation protein FlgA [plant metagenome]|uniref:Flagellar basal-body P-ring formation protein FlgA n=1 Tax=plant metagenome TaxID=1297885 RepID=A0A484SDF0_9ZZZZ